MNASASVVGNQTTPVRVVIVVGAIEAISDGERPVRIIWTGLYPRNAAKSAPVGGIALIAGISGVALAVESASVSIGGNAFVRPNTIIVKNIPIDRTNPEFIRVDIIPEETPRLSAGTEFIIAAALGELNIPLPRPMIINAIAKVR
jgi:hypothetical protein